MGTPIDKALALLQENHEVCRELPYGCPWREALESGIDRARIGAIMAALEHLLGEEMDLLDRLLQQVRVASKSFSIVVASPEAMQYRDDLAFFQAVDVELRRARTVDRPGADDDVELETAIRLVVSNAVPAAGVTDIYAAAEIGRPDQGNTDEEFAMRLAIIPTSNVQIELMRRPPVSQVRSMSRRKVAAERKFTEMLERTMKSYNNRNL